MSGINGNPATHFGRQMHKERRARGWTLQDLARETGINVGHLSRIETGRRPPTERIALACDAAFPNRNGWFLEYYEELRGWSEVPAAFRDWSEYEDGATTLRVWQPSILDGLLQTEDYTQALLVTLPGSTPQTINVRLASRMERQRRILCRDEPPHVLFIVDEPALYRRVGSAGIMARQLAHLLEVAALPHVTLQVMPAMEHCLNASGLVIADERATYAENVASGFVYTDEQTVSTFSLRLDTLRGECYRVSESTTLLERMQERWATGVSPLSVMPTEASA
ncbi:MAG: helix-turn-helix transcriptional regulator [Streptosporangiales bacterium]|nr:helix-turn-helix transcriptional regulator [Streptosporangiales bacterium]